MIKKYEEYLNESLDLLLESNVEFSKNFLSIISKIDNPIAKDILSIYGKDLDITANYIDIDKDKNDTVTFTPDRRAQQVLKDTDVFYRFIGSGGGWLTHGDANKGIFDKLGYTFEEGAAPYIPNSRELGKEVSRIVSAKSGKIFLLVEFPDGKGVYNMDKLRPVDNRTNIIWSKGRQEIKIGRVIRALLTTAKIEFKDRDIESFVNSYKAAIDKFNDKFSFFEEVEGDDIIHWYDSDNYYESDGTLGNSCMAGMGSRVLGIYEDSDNISMIIYKCPEDDTKILGRAILWKLINGKRFMDRVYTINDSDVNLFREYAKENGIYSKRYNNSSSDDDVFNPDGTIGNIELSCQISKNEENFPYMDTLKYYCPETGIISNEPDLARDGDDDYVVYECEDTDGGYSEY